MHITKDNCVKIFNSDRILYLGIAICSAMVFVSLYGIQILNPTYTDWLLSGGDLSQHYLGWKAFRKGAWTFPIGLTDRLAYPNYTSVMFTDSIPLFAVIFKILSPVLPEDFQYFGLWGIMCFILQGCLTARIIKIFIEDKLIIIVSSILVVFSPVMLMRMYGHTALAGQWILLILICPLLAYDKYKKGNKIYIEAALAAFIATSTHMYLALICGIIILGVCLRDVLENKKIIRMLLILCSYVVVVLVTAWVLGGFSSAGTSFEAGGLGCYSMNLNALYNPQGWSSFLKDKVLYTGEQYEGFGYLGTGGLLLFIFVAITLWSKSNFIESIKTNWKKIVSLVFVIVVVSFVASAPVVTFNDIKLFELTLPAFITKAWSTFRACGRIVMALPYIVIISFVIIGRKLTSKRFTTILILACFFAQLVDIYPALARIRQRFDGKVEYQSSLETKELWAAIAANQNIEHMVVTYWVGENPFYVLGEYALSNNKTLNTFALVHPNVDQLLKDVEVMLQNPTADEIFIFNATDWTWTKYPDLNFYDVGNYLIGYSGELDGFEHINDLHMYNYQRDVSYKAELINHSIDEDGLWDFLSAYWEDENVTIFLSALDEASSALDQTARDAFARLGLCELSMIGYRDSYLAVISGGNVLCEQRDHGKHPTETDGIGYHLASGGFDSGNTSSIMINNIEYSPQKRGINVIIYDTLLKAVINQASFDTCMIPVNITNCDAVSLAPSFSEDGLWDFLSAYRENENAIIFLSAMDDAAGSLDEIARDTMAAQGLTELSTLGYRDSYLAVIHGGQVIYEQKDHGEIPIETNGIGYNLVSGGYESGNVSSIIINGKEYSLGTRGINAVVYDTHTNRVIERVSFDTCMIPVRITAP